jgi:hypothetical protein
MTNRFLHAAPASLEQFYFYLNWFKANLMQVDAMAGYWGIVDPSNDAALLHVLHMGTA